MFDPIRLSWTRLVLAHCCRSYTQSHIWAHCAFYNISSSMPDIEYTLGETQSSSSNQVMSLRKSTVRAQRRASPDNTGDKFPGLKGQAGGYSMRGFGQNET